MDDDTPMPFGKHKGLPMWKVPADYLLWLWDNGKKDDTGNDVHKYIKENFSAILSDAKDYIYQGEIPKA